MSLPFAPATSLIRAPVKAHSQGNQRRLGEVSCRAAWRILTASSVVYGNRGFSPRRLAAFRAGTSIFCAGLVAIFSFWYAHDNTAPMPPSSVETVFGALPAFNSASL